MEPFSINESTTIGDELAKLNELMSSLRLNAINEVDDTRNQNEHNDIVFDYGSDDYDDELNMADQEHPTQESSINPSINDPSIPRPYYERGESSNRQTRPQSPEPNHNIPYGELGNDLDQDNIMFRNGYVKNHKGKWQYIPSNYVPKDNPGEEKILDLDCAKDPFKRIQEWGNMLQMEYMTNSALSQIRTRNLIWPYIRFRTKGAVAHFLTNKLDIDAVWPDSDTNIPRGIGRIQSAIAIEFCGLDPSTIRDNVEYSKEALYHITNMKLCNLCYFENFFCEYQQKFHLLTKEDQTLALEIFWDKFPFEIGKHLRTTFNVLTNDVAEGGERIPYTLGGAGRLVREWIRRQCNKKMMKRQANVSLCCDMQNDRIGKYGCNDENKSRKRSLKEKYRKRYKRKYKDKYRGKRFKRIPGSRYKDFRRRNPRKRWFRRRRHDRRNEAFEPSDNNPKSDKKFCPSKKTNCRCWLCNEIGHIAKDCTNKKDNKMAHAILNLALVEKLEPVEYSDSDVSSQSSRYVYTSEEDEFSDSDFSDDE